MRVCLISDRSFTNREYRLVRRLKVGLLDEGVQVVHAIPAEGLKNAPSDLTQVVQWDDRGRYFSRKGQAASCIHALQRINLPESQQPTTGPIDVIEVWGDTAWPMSLEIAVETDAVLVLHAWRARSLEMIPKIEKMAERDHPDLRAVWITPDDTFLDRARSVAHRWPVRCIPWGVHAPQGPRGFPRGNQPIAACIIATGDDADACCRAIRGIAPVVTGSARDFLVFLDEMAVERHPRVWKTAEQAGLLERLSVIADMESRRDLVLRSDLLIVPEVLHSHRSFLLDALATGMVVLTPETPDVDAIRDETVIRLSSTASAAWEDALRRVVEHPEQADELTRSAHEWVTRSRRVHEQISRTLETYEALFSQEPIEFPAGAGPKSGRSIP